MSDSGSSPSPTYETVSANQLRRVAEWADGKRGEDFVLSMHAPLRDGTSGFGLRPLKAGEPPAPGDIAVRTDRRVKGKMKPREILVHHPNDSVRPIPVSVDVFDAIFWDEVSAE